MKRYNHRDRCQIPDVGSLKEEFSTQISCVLPLKNSFSFKGAKSFKGIRRSNNNPYRTVKNQKIPIGIIPIGIQTNSLKHPMLRNDSNG